MSFEGGDSTKKVEPDAIQEDELNQGEKATKNVEDFGEDGEEEDEESENDLPDIQPDKFTFYLHPKMAYRVVSKSWVPFTLIGFLAYLYHLFWAVYGVDRYCDYTRFHTCGDETTLAKASSVFDGAILACSIFHIIEWVRQTLFLTTALVNVNLMWPYYLLCCNFLLGFAATLAGTIVGFTSPAECIEKQSSRALYLKLQLIVFILHLVIFNHHIIFFRIAGKDWLWKVLTTKDDDEDDD